MLGGVRKAFFCILLMGQGLVAAERLNVAISSAPNNLNPFFSTDANSQNINRLVHITLTDFNKSMKFSCRLCKSYSERVEGGKHIISFLLRDDVFFWDGTLVTASDVKNSVEYYANDADIKSIFRFAFGKISDVRIIDKNSVELVYDKFSLENLSNLALLKILKIKKVKGQKIGVPEIIGAGPYKYEKILPLRVDLTPARGQNLKKLSFKVVKDETTLALKILNEEIDISLANISPRKLFWLKKQKSGLAFDEIQSSNYVYMGINHRDDLLKDRQIRKAIAHLIPREDILKYKLKDTAVISNGFMSKAFSSYYRDLKFDEFDPVKSNQILSQLGYKKNSDGFYEKDGKVLKLDWKVSNNSATVELVRTIKSYLNKNGIDLDVTTMEWGTFMKSVKTGNFDIMIGRWVGFTGPDIMNYVFHSKSLPPKGANRGAYINKELDEILDKAEAEVEEKNRADLYAKAQQILNQDYAYVNLWHPKIIWIRRKCLGDLSPWPNGSFLPLLEVKPKC